MNVYLAIITTVLVITQVIRVTQNAIQLRRQKRQIDKYVAWIMDNDVSEQDFETQREVYWRLKIWLRDQQIGERPEQ